MSKARGPTGSYKEEPIFTPAVVIAFLSSVYLGRYRCLNTGNLNMFKERNPPSLSD